VDSGEIEAPLGRILEGIHRSGLFVVVHPSCNESSESGCGQRAMTNKPAPRATRRLPSRGPFARLWTCVTCLFRFRWGDTFSCVVFQRGRWFDFEKSYLTRWKAPQVMLHADRHGSVEAARRAIIALLQHWFEVPRYLAFKTVKRGRILYLRGMA